MAFAMRAAGLPSAVIWDILMKKGWALIVHEDKLCDDPRVPNGEEPYDAVFTTHTWMLRGMAA